MRIAYLTPYKGPGLLERRPSIRNLSLSNKVKIELVCQALLAKGHQVKIISQGEVDRYQAKFYGAFQEPKPFRPDVSTYYISSLPVRFLTGLWAQWQSVKALKALHRRSPFDLMILFNMRPGHNACAAYAGRLRLPFILEYEDDAFVDVYGRAAGGFRARRQREACLNTLRLAAGGIGVSPHLLSQFRAEVPKLLLRGVVSDDIAGTGEPVSVKKNWIVYTGTHNAANGIGELIQAFGRVNAPGWELHICGHGEKTPQFKELAAQAPGVVFHGMLDRPALVEVLRSARLCVNAQALSQTPGNVFPFKVVEYLAAGAHVLSTPMGELEKDLAPAVSYMADNQPQTIAAALQTLIQSGAWQRTAAPAARAVYGLPAVAESLDRLLRQVAGTRGSHASPRTAAAAAVAAR